MQVQQPGSGVNWPGAGYGAVALFGNLLYFPAKLVYATLGEDQKSQQNFGRALQLAPTDPERRYLARKLAETSPRPS